MIDLAMCVTPPVGAVTDILIGLRVFLCLIKIKKGSEIGNNKI